MDVLERVDRQEAETAWKDYLLVVDEQERRAVECGLAYDHERVDQAWERYLLVVKAYKTSVPKHILAIGVDEMTTIATGGDTKVCIDMQTGTVYHFKGNQLTSVDQPCCDQPDIHWEQVGSMYFTAGDVCDDSYDVCQCHRCGTVLYDESEQPEREIKF